MSLLGGLYWLWSCGPSAAASCTHAEYHLLFPEVKCSFPLFGGVPPGLSWLLTSVNAAAMGTAGKPRHLLSSPGAHRLRTELMDCTEEPSEPFQTLPECFPQQNTRLSYQHHSQDVELAKIWHCNSELHEYMWQIQLSFINTKFYLHFISVERPRCFSYHNTQDTASYSIRTYLPWLNKTVQFKKRYTKDRVHKFLIRPKGEKNPKNNNKKLEHSLGLIGISFTIKGRSLSLQRYRMF